MSRVVIQVGAQADRSLTDVVRPLVDSMKKARAAAGVDARAAAQHASRMAIEGFRAEARVHLQYVRAKLRAERDATRESVALTRQAAREAARAEREKAKALEHVYQIRQRYIAQQEKEAAAARKSRVQTALGVGVGAMRTLGGVARAGVGVGRDVLRGAGVNFDLASMVGAGVNMEAQAVALSNAAFRGKKGEERIDPAELVRLSKSIGNEFAFDPSKTMGGLAAFQEKTGQLDVGTAGLREWSSFAKSTGTDLDILIASAGEVGNALGDAFATPQAKARAITDVLKTLGAQGQEGAVEFRNLATQMPKLAAAAVSFAGNRAENLKKMGALVQLAKQQGGAPSATSAATSIAGFANIFKTPARVKQFEEAGIDVFSKKKGEEGRVRNPFELMKEALEKKGMDPLGFKRLFANVVGAKPAEALAVTYREAGGGKEGIKAVEKLLDKFMGEMDDKKLRGDLQAAMSTQASKVQLLNNQLTELGATFGERLLPRLQEAAPTIIKFVEAMLDAVGWAAENPGRAITLAITASIAKAAIGDAVSGGIKSLLSSGIGGGIGGAKGVSGGFLGGAGLALSIGLATVMIASALIDVAEQKRNKGREEAISDTDKALSVALEAKKAAAEGKALDPTKMAEIEAQRAALQERIAAAEKHTTTDTFQAYNPFSDRTLRQEGKETNDQMILGSLRATLASLDASVKMLANKELKATVNVTQAAPGVDERGRQ